MNLPWVSRAKYEALEFELRCVRLQLTVSENELTHCERGRRSLINELAKATQQNVDLVRERDAWHAEAVR